jgi:hypothetical protein
MHEIPWSAPLRDPPTRRDRDQLVRAWRYRMWNESGASSAFDQLALLAGKCGAPESLVEEMRSSAEDEVRHADACRKLVSRFSGETDVEPPAPFPDLPLRRTDTDEARALEGIALMSCISETIGCAFQREIADGATDPAVHAAQEIFYTEELRHGRFGWAYLAFEAKRAPERVKALEARIPALVAAYARGLAEISEGAPDRGVALEPFGILSVRHTQKLFRDALHRLVIPGFEEFGLDLDAVKRAYPVI